MCRVRSCFPVVCCLLLAATAVAAGPGRVIEPVWDAPYDTPITFDTTRMATAVNNSTLRDVALGSRFKSLSDDTVRVAAMMSSNARQALLFTDTATGGAIRPFGWRPEGANGRYIDSSGGAYYGCAIGDANNDGLSDLVYGRSGLPYVLFRAWWNGAAWQTESLPVGGFSGTIYDVAIGDANNDGNNEVLLAAGNGLYRLNWTGSSWSRESLYYRSGTICRGVAIGDFDTTHFGNEVAAVTEYLARVLKISYSGTSWDTALIYSSVSLRFYDVAIGDYDPDCPGAELVAVNGYNQATWGNLMLLRGSGSAWNLTQVKAYTAWSDQGEVAVGNVLDLHPGNEIVAVPGNTGGSPIVLYKCDTTWYAQALRSTGGATFGVATGKVNRWRTTSPVTEEMAISGNYRLYEYEQRSAGAVDAGVTQVSLPGTYTAVSGVPIAVRMDFENRGQDTLRNIPTAYRAPTGTVNDSWLGVLAPGARAGHSFSTAYTPSSEGLQALRCSLGLGADAGRIDDTLSTQFQVFAAGTRVGQLFNFTAFPPPGWGETLIAGSAHWTRAGNISQPSVVPLEGGAQAYYNSANRWIGEARLVSHRFGVGSEPAEIRLRFYMFADTGRALKRDRVIIEYSLDSLTFIPLDSVMRHQSQHGWRPREFTLGNFEAGTRLSIALRAVADSGNNMCVDSFRVYTLPPSVAVNDVGVEFVSMPQPLFPGDSYPVTVHIRNYGIRAQTSIPVSYDAGAGPVSAVWTGSLAPFGRASYTFSPYYTPGDTGEFTIRGATALGGDTDASNDTAATLLRACVSFHPTPYGKDFDEDWQNSYFPPWCGWRIIPGGSETLETVNDNDWLRYERTFPYRTVARTSSWSPPEASDDRLISPRLNCSLPGTYRLSFWHYYNDYTPDRLDSGLVLLSTDDGATWPVCIARYSNQDYQGDQQFDISSHVSGQANVRISFHYRADNEQYWDIDDFVLTFIPSIPNLLSPASGSLVTSSFPEFDWTDCIGAQRYRIQLAHDSLFSLLVLDESLLSASRYQAGPLPDGGYYWRVAAGAGIGWSDYTSPWQVFIDATAPDAPVLISPEDRGLIISGDLDFFWTRDASNERIRYRLQIDDDPLFGSPWLDSSGTDTSLFVTGLPDHTRFYWQVIARDSAGNNSNPSARREFVTAISAPAAPALVAPANHQFIRTTEPVFIWNKPQAARRVALRGRAASPQATLAFLEEVAKRSSDQVVKGSRGRSLDHSTTGPLGRSSEEAAPPELDAVINYRLQVSASSRLDSLELDVIVPETSYAVTAPSPLGPGVHYWHVAAIDSAGNTSAWSATWDFQIDLGGPDSGWTMKADMPLGNKGKKVKDGGCLTYLEQEEDTDERLGYIYALKGNNRVEFYQYNTVANTWTTRDSIPAVGSSGKKKQVKKGASICEHGGMLYATKGGNTLEYWRYDPTLAGTPTYPWTQLGDVPAGAKNIKEGSGQVAVGDNIYLLRGSAGIEFYRYDPAGGTWTSLASAPTGASGKPYKDGSNICTDGVNTIYALKGTYGEFYAYRIDSNAWTTLAALPVTGSAGKKKVKAGSSSAFSDGTVYALKGGNTFEFWSYQVDSNRWTELANVPTGGGKKVKGGGSLVLARMASGLYALKGNNTVEFFRFGLTADGPQAAGHKRQATSSNSQTSGSLEPGARSLQLDVAPNPFSGATRVTYSLSRGGSVSLKLYDINGNLVSVLSEGHRAAGNSSFTIHGSSLSSGVYLLKLEAGNTITTAKLILE